MTTRKIWPARKRLVLERAGRKCERCGATALLEIHHKLEHSKGGTHDMENLEVLCNSCHKWETTWRALCRNATKRFYEFTG